MKKRVIKKKKNREIRSNVKYIRNIFNNSPNYYYYGFKNILNNNKRSIRGIPKINNKIKIKEIIYEMPKAQVWQKEYTCIWSEGLNR